MPLASYMDAFTAPLNPCSLETLPGPPLELADGSSVWPVMVSCYQLDDDVPHPQQHGDPQHGDHSAPQPPAKATRRGHMDLYTVKVPDIAGSTQNSLPLQFGPPAIQVLNANNSSGILDGKWFPKPTTRTSSTNSNSNTRATDWCFATAHSSGVIRIHTLSVPPKDETGVRLDTDPLLKIVHSGMSEPPRTTTTTTSVPVPAPLCLSLNWDTPPGGVSYNHPRNNNNNNNNNHHHKNPYSDDDDDMFGGSIVSTYSNGCVAIHDVAFLEDHRVQLVERDSWKAHNIFTSPAEVWSACFFNPRGHCHCSSCSGTTNNINTHHHKWIISCGDEGKVKCWDERSTQRPVQVLDPFQAGATAVAPHPRQDYVFAVGSYDETVCIYDVRYLGRGAATKKASGGGCMANTTTEGTNDTYTTTTTTAAAASHVQKSVGGGVWRLKWHPLADDRLLVAAMHGGCRVLRVRGWDRFSSNTNTNTSNTSEQQIIPPPLVPREAEESCFQQQQQQHTFHGSPPHGSLASSSSTSSSSHVNATTTNTTWLPPKITKKFVEHESMAYGADWLVCPHPTQEGYFEAAASCSFYDRSVYLWDSVF